MFGKRVSAVIMNEKEILLMHRTRAGRDYFVLPGGSVEEGENNEQALKREVREETGLNVEIAKELWQIDDDSDRRKQYIYLIARYAGEVKLGGPEKGRQAQDNQYALEWHAINQIDDLLIYPEEIKEKIGLWQNMD